MEKGPYYLAGPHKGTLQQEADRITASLKLTVAFLTQGIHVFSPIVYAAKIAEALQPLSEEERREIIFPCLLSFLKISKGMILITMEGWKESWGVQQELLFCQEHRIPVYMVHPNDISDDLSRILFEPLDQTQIRALLEAA